MNLLTAPSKVFNLSVSVLRTQHTESLKPTRKKLDQVCVHNSKTE